MPIAFESDKVMFEIYKDPSYSGRYRVVYFTELNDHNREAEFNNALRGEHFFDGFIANYRKDEAKAVIEDCIQRLNRGETVSARELEDALKPFTPGR
ncbi:MAG: hypothetical protein ACE14M_02320 [Terriglobales bacterium]